jgi:predicted lipid-binding transport protein (Tim44 family)
MERLMETLRARFGPFPLWVWLTLITALGLTYYLYERRKQGSAPATPAEGTAQVPETVNQVQVTVPPEAPEPSAPVPKPPPVVGGVGGEHNTATEALEARQQAAEQKTIGQQRQEIAALQREERQDVATHHGQHRHKAPPRRHRPPPRRPRPPGVVTTPARMA